MPLPAGLLTIQIRGDLRSFNAGATSKGRIQIIPAAALYAPTQNVILTPAQPITTTIASDGTFLTDEMVSPGDPAVTPQDMPLMVIVRTRTYNDQWYVQIPHGASGVIDLADLPRSTSAPAMVTYAMVSQLLDYIPKSLVDAKGDLLAATGDGTLTRFPAGADGQVVTADSSTPTGLKWAAGGGGGGGAVTSVNAEVGDVVLSAADVGAIPSTLVNAKGDLLGASGDDTPVRVAVGATGDALLADSSQPAGVRWGNSARVKAFTNTGLVIGTFGPCGVSGSWTVCSAAYRSVPCPAAVGDLLDWKFGAILGAGTATADAEFDLATIDNSNVAAPVILRCLSSGSATPLSNGMGALYCWANNARRIPAVEDWQVAAEDIVANTVTFALLYRAGGSGLSVGHAAVYPSRVTVTNKGAA